ncbi:Nrap protein [Fomitiporia mediterranea MF3/22]|uniref:Nrap protein n=1 Tax=Fomitiporia mediterranea (strain MF3/22) TaxID=694068 RepID=UPI0004408365|nr:Nrap protein [Fomitiporia mediterranea MF3/22]EJD08517.1 Nrap protein [Fomitiporia mediterranea MF3/22]
MQDEEDEEGWGGIHSSDEGTIDGTNIRARQDRKHANRPPTHTELRSIKEASELYKSNVFKLAIDALLPNVRPKESRIKPLEEFLHILYTVLMSLKSTPPSHPSEASRALSKQGITVPYAAPQPTAETAWKVSFEKPSDIVIVGSWATKTGVKSVGSASWSVDVAVEMPAEIFQEKDYLDCRFFHKRAFYLASLALAIRSDDRLNVDVSYDCPYDARLTSLVLTPYNDGSSTDFSKLNACVRLLPVLPSPCPVSLHHLSPTHCNIRVKVSDGAASDDSANANNASTTRPTPIYNTDLLMHASARTPLLQTHTLIKEVPSFRDALALLRVWANQRGYGPGSKDRGVVSGFEGNGYFWTGVMHVIVVGEEDFGEKGGKKRTLRRPVGRGLSSYQLFRAALDFLANHAFCAQPVFIKGGSRFPADTYSSDGPVFVDVCSVNIVAGIPVTSIDLLRHDAKITLDLLNNGSQDSKADPFSDVFLRDRRQLSTRFDVTIQVDLRRMTLRRSNLVDILDHGSPSQLAIHTLSSILRRALGDRVHAIGINTTTNGLRPLSQGDVLPPLNKVHIGLILNTENAFRVIDHGPAASDQDTKEATEFRELWGTKAELRRFKDGRILESVVWEVKSADDRARIPADVVCYILSRHFGLEVERDVKVVQKDFELVQRVVLPGAQPGFKNAMMAFDGLLRQLKSLDEEIPLAILNVSPVSSDLRYTGIFTPTPIPPKHANSLSVGMRYLPAMEVIVQFERSGRWPDDLGAIQKMKLAFFEQMASALMGKVPGLVARIVVCDPQRMTMTSERTLDNAYLEIVTKEGWAFAARIWHDREAMLLKRILEDKKKPRPVANGSSAVSTPDGSKTREYLDRQSAQKAYEAYARRYLHAPKHHRAIANLCHRFPAYVGTVRLVKRWLTAHWLLEGHINGEAVELLCAFVFVGSTKNGGGGDKRLDVPGTKELGFFRVLTFLKEWTWEDGLFVALYETDGEAEEEQKESGAAYIKAGSGNGVWRISTSEDPSGAVWTGEGPDALVARRIKMLAGASVDYVLANEWEGFVPKTLFLHPTGDYDILIHLKPDVLCRTHQALDVRESTSQRYANIPTASGEDDEPLRVDYDPALMYFHDLKRMYQGTLAFFFDAYGGEVIGGVWDPGLVGVPRPFRVLADYSSTPQTDDDTDTRKRKASASVVLNQTTVLAEIRRLGEGLVRSIEVQPRSK